MSCLDSPTRHCLCCVLRRETNWCCVKCRRDSFHTNSLFDRIHEQSGAWEEMPEVLAVMWMRLSEWKIAAGVITGGFYFNFFKIQMIKQKMTTNPVSFNLHLISLEKKTCFQFILSIVTLQKHCCSAKSIWTLVLTSSVNMRRWNFLRSPNQMFNPSMFTMWRWSLHLRAVPPSPSTKVFECLLIQFEYFTRLYRYQARHLDTACNKKSH